MSSSNYATVRGLAQKIVTFVFITKQIIRTFSRYKYSPTNGSSKLKFTFRVKINTEYTGHEGRQSSKMRGVERVGSCIIYQD